jgi:arylsulfatase A-like enzyme
MKLLRLRRFDRDVGRVLVAFVLLLALENLVVGFGWRAHFVGAWEMGSARHHASPIAIAVALPTAIALVGIARLARGGRPAAVAFVGALGGVALAFGVSTGRRMASLFVRAPFVVTVTVAAAGLTWALAHQLPRARRSRTVALGTLAVVATWLADAFVLPRLYPAFHTALFFVMLTGASAWALLFRGTAVAWVGLVIGTASVGWAPWAAARMAGHDNVRMVLLEHAPILGRAVRVAARIAPPPALEEDETATTTLAGLSASRARALDFRGRDIVVVTIDALRADHVSAYGYGRKTTPNIDMLAARGARFEHAYCPTPHTSYSVASMMTGKYMKPLLAMGKEDDSETWATQLRRYGYRTAAFYPPAVFFIDEHRFTRMRDEHLGFEYAKEEFAKPALRRAQIEEYLASAPADKPLFLWAHLFEPHEPYEMHPEHAFSGEPRVDAYDSEIAAADALVGDIHRLVEARRPGAVFVVSADHGEEHGDHGGHYHGTTVYEEQVRVPLVVSGPGIDPRVIAGPVQTIDLLPTTLAALDVPLPPRIRGRDLGPVLAGTEQNGQGLAFAETDDWTLLARGNDRLVCARKIASCTLFDVGRDPGERVGVSDRPERVAELRKLTAAIQRETGKLEANDMPEALRRGLQGDRDAAEDVAPLLDDARVEIRRAAAQCAFHLRAPEMVPALKRALERDDDARVRRWSGLALLRLGEAPEALGIAALTDDREEERVAAALALAERGDGRGEAELVARWGRAAGTELAEAREMLAAFAKLRSRSAVPGLIKALPDVRLRPFIVEALGEIGDTRAKPALLKLWNDEPYVHLRGLEGQALVKLGARFELLPALVRYAGAGEPFPEAIRIARDAKVLAAERFGRSWIDVPRTVVPRLLDFRWPKMGPARLYVLTDGATSVSGSIRGETIADVPPWTKDVFVIETSELAAGKVALSLRPDAGRIAAVWLVPRSSDGGL